MKIGLAQTRPIPGDIPCNIQRHESIVRQAIANDSQMVIFPELSLTGYEPSLAAALATDEHDERLAIFQRLSDEHAITIAVGLPTRHNAGVCISLMIFQSKLPRRTYSKAYLHRDEEPFFVPGERFVGLIGDNNTALAICYELSVPEHAAQAARNGANIYISSVAKSATGVAAANERLAHIAREYSQLVLMVNSIGPADNFVCVGGSAVWNRQGKQLAKLDDNTEAILLLDTRTDEALEVSLS